ncbi:hypothetical protein FQN57_003923 [Myotisia sp. PD_48]|nr:hypothetical protein FQN57_003923 [Myotisia sp. PD_48]
MTEALPNGIVSNTSEISSELKNTDHVEVEDVARLWKVYTTNRTTLERDAGRRLENLFWRIWSNGRLSKTISGYTLAHLFIKISEGDSSEDNEWFSDGRENGNEASEATPINNSLDIHEPPGHDSVYPSDPAAIRNTTLTASIEQHRDMERPILPPSILKNPLRSMNADTDNSSSPTSSVDKGSIISSSSSEYLDGQNPRTILPRPKQKKASFAVELTTSHEAPVCIPMRAEHTFPSSQASEDAGVIRPESPPLKFRSPFDNSSIKDYYQRQEGRAHFTHPRGTNLPPSPQFKHPFEPDDQLEEDRSEGGLHDYVPSQASNPTVISRNKTPHESLQSSLTPTTYSNSQCGTNQQSPQCQPSSASLVEKGFRAKFVKKQAMESHVSSLTNLMEHQHLQDHYNRRNASKKPMLTSTTPSTSSSLSIPRTTPSTQGFNSVQPRGDPSTSNLRTQSRNNSPKSSRTLATQYQPDDISSSTSTVIHIRTTPTKANPKTPSPTTVVLSTSPRPVASQQSQLTRMIERENRTG